MSTFERRSELAVPADALWAWHLRPGAIDRLSPPFSKMEVEQQFSELKLGARTVFRVGMGPVHSRWVAEITALEPGHMFQDTQLEGPFKSWVHTHRMESRGQGQSTLVDAIEYELPAGPLGRLFGARAAHRNLERLFDYRHAITAMDLARHHGHASQRRLTVAIAGASGLIGSALTAFLTTGGHSVRRLVRGAPATGSQDIRWDPVQGEIDRHALEGVDAIVNLAGESVAGGRWSDERKERIRQSRVRGTRLIAEAITRLERPPSVFLNGSAIGFYGDRGDEELREQSSPGEGFLADVCKEWEAATAPAEDAGVRIAHLRTGMVLSASGGALKAMLTPFKLGVGGPIGGGQQWVSWISLEDMVGAMHFGLFESRFSGPINMVSPQPVPQAEFARVLGRVLSRPAVAPLPSPAVRAGFGSMGDELLLASQRVLPTALGAQGFPFIHPDLEAALRFTLGRTR